MNKIADGNIGQGWFTFERWPIIYITIKKRLQTHAYPRFIAVILAISIAVKLIEYCNSKKKHTSRIKPYICVDFGGGET